ncbi:MAG: hypothetical protein AAGG09_12815 [Pseudomonadota bacterium]
MSKPSKTGAKAPGDAAEDTANQDEKAQDDAVDAAAESEAEGHKAEDEAQAPDTDAEKEDAPPDAQDAEDGATKADRKDDDASDESGADATAEGAEPADGADTPAEAETAADGSEPAAERDPSEVDGEDGDPPLTEDEQREIAEAALRDAERGYISDDGRYSSAEESADAGSEPTSDKADAAPQEADAQVSGAQAATAGAAVAGAAVAGAAAAQAPAPEVVVEKRGGVLPGFLGGVIAVAGAAFALPYVLPESMRPVMSLEPVEAALGEQSSRIGGLAEQAGSLAEQTEGLAGRVGGVEGALSNFAAAEAVAALETRLDELEARIAASIEAQIANETAGLTGRIDELATDMAQLERSPIEDATDPAVIAALEAFRSEMQRVRDEVAAQTAENTRVIEEAAEATAEARARAEAEEAAAAERAAQAAQMQALADIKAALDSGLPYGDPLSVLEADVPDALSAGQGGVATLAALQAAFSDPARSALDAARRADVGDAPAERGLTFLQTQLGMRSLAPRDGDGVDAILSRAEAATRDGDLPTAVTELNALPDPARAAMQEWIARATMRVDAIAAADALAQSLATN